MLLYKALRIAFGDNAIIISITGTLINAALHAQ